MRAKHQTVKCIFLTEITSALFALHTFFCQKVAICNWLFDEDFRGEFSLNAITAATHSAFVFVLLSVPQHFVCHFQRLSRLLTSYHASCKQQVEP